MKAMGTNKDVLNGWIVSLGITVAVVVGAFGFFAYRELHATVKARRIEVGDTFSVHWVNENPYDEDFMFGGTVIATNGVYIQYVDDDGDTLSTNIRDCYLFKNSCTVVVSKEKRKGG